MTIPAPTAAPAIPGDHESAAAQVSASMAQSPPRVAVDAPASAAVLFPMFNFHSTHDFRDFGPNDLKRDPGREWERDQQREHTPGLGRR